VVDSGVVAAQQAWKLVAASAADGSAVASGGDCPPQGLVAW
jgi:hypothetical protein